MRYTPKFFRDSLPEWKKKECSLLERIFYRPVSSYFSSIAASLKISANTVSYFTLFLALLACVFYLFRSPALSILGAVLINLWRVLDSVDGSIARCIKKQPFGEYADSLSSYFLVGLICTSMSMSVFFSGGILFEAGNPWIIFMGALASSSDSLMRLGYQKYRYVAKELQEKGVIPPENLERRGPNSVGGITIRIEKELGISGILPLLILIATIFNTLDLIIVYCFIYYGSACAVSTLKFVRKTIRYSRVPH